MLLDLNPSISFAGRLLGVAVLAATAHAVQQIGALRTALKIVIADEFVADADNAARGQEGFDGVGTSDYLLGGWVNGVGIDGDFRFQQGLAAYGGWPQRRAQHQRWQGNVVADFVHGQRRASGARSGDVLADDTIDDDRHMAGIIADERYLDEVPLIDFESVSFVELVTVLN